MKNDFLTIPDAPNYEINSEFIVRNKKTGKFLTATKRCYCNVWVVTVFNGNEIIKRSIRTFRRQAEAAVHDAQVNDDYWVKVESLGGNYELNSKGVLRNSSTKRVLKKSYHKRWAFFALTFNNKRVNRSLKDLMWECFGIVYKKQVVIPLFATKNRVCKKFDTMADFVRFLVKNFNCNFDSTYNIIRKNHPTEFYGYKLSYVEPTDFSTMPAVVGKYVRGL